MLKSLLGHAEGRECFTGWVLNTAAKARGQAGSQPGAGGGWRQWSPGVLVGQGYLACPVVPRRECGSAGIPAVQLCPWPGQAQVGMPGQGSELRRECPGSGGNARPGLRAEVAMPRLRWECGSAGIPARQPCPWPGRRRGAYGMGSLPAAGSCKQGLVTGIKTPVPTHSSTAYRFLRPLKFLSNSSSVLLKVFGFLLPSFTAAELWRQLNFNLC